MLSVTPSAFTRKPGERGAQQLPAGGAEGLQQRRLQQAVLQDVAEVRFADVRGLEDQGAAALSGATLSCQTHMRS